MEKIRLIYDATILREMNAKTSSRTGVYSVGYHVLAELLKDDRFDIAAYSRPEYSQDVHSALESDEFRSYKIMLLNRAGLPASVNRFFDGFGGWWRSLSFRPNVERKILKGLTLPVRIVQKATCDAKKGFTAGYDIYLSPMTEDIPEKVMADASIKKVVVLHDAIPVRFPQYYPEARSDRYPLRRLLGQMSGDSDNIYGLADSENTRKDFVKLLPAEVGERIYVTLAGCSADHFRKVDSPELAGKVRDRYNIPQGVGYIFSLCTLEPRKNLIRAVRCFIEFIRKHDITDLYFVLGGAHWDSFIRSLEDAIDGLDEYKKYIIRAGYVDDTDLPVLYSNAIWFVYTSQYEGFGIPPLEAMSCGCPVITSNNSSIPEVVGDAGIMIDWDSDEQHIKAYERYYYDSALRAEMSARGLEQAKKFTWDRIGKGIADRLVELTRTAR